MQTQQQATIAATIQTLRLTVNDDGTTTMTSLELVDFIDSIRGLDDKELRHDHFMVKVPTVIKEAAPKFLGTAFYMVNGAKRERVIYVLPERETMLMVMSYDIDMQATAYDAWQAEKNKNATPVAVIPNFDDPVAAAEAWLVERKQANSLKLELSTAADALEASATL